MDDCCITSNSPIFSAIRLHENAERDATTKKNLTAPTDPANQKDEITTTHTIRYSLQIIIVARMMSMNGTEVKVRAISSSAHHGAPPLTLQK